MIELGRWAATKLEWSCPARTGQLATLVPVGIFVLRIKFFAL